MAKKATFRDAEILRRARAARRNNATARPRTRTIPGYHIQPMLPLHLGLLNAVCDEAEFTEYDGVPCVEALIRLGNGMVKGPYTVVLSLQQAIEADIIGRD